jgi:8-oxo-dGTP pyrophosphatase MutT (NUDIX family)
VLVIRRSARHRFLPGYVVFPGGAVDAEDDGLGQEWFGDASQAVRACAGRNERADRERVGVDRPDPVRVHVGYVERAAVG